MDEIGFTLENHPVIDTLRFDFLCQNSFVAVKKIDSPLKFPYNFNNDSLPSFFQDMNNCKLTQVFEKYKLVIPLSANKIAYLYQTEMKRNNKTQATFYLLHLCIVWVMQAESGNLEIPLSVIVTAINQIRFGGRQQTIENMLEYMLYINNTYKCTQSFTNLYKPLHNYFEGKPVATKQILTLLCEWIQYAILNKNDNEKAEIVSFLAELIETNTVQLDTNKIPALFATLLGPLLQFDTIFLSFFSRVIKYFDPMFTDSIFSDAPSSLLTAVLESDPQNLVDIQKDKSLVRLKLPSIHPAGIFPEPETFLNGAVFAFPDLPIPRSHKTLFPRSVAVPVDFFMKMIAQSTSGASNFSMKAKDVIYHTQDDPHFGDIILSFLCSLSNAPDYEYLSDFNRFILTTDFFNGNVTIFDDIMSKYSTTSQVRAYTYKQCCKTPMVLIEFLERHQGTPYMVAEIFLVFTKRIREIPLEFLSSKLLIESVSQIMERYRNFAFDNFEPLEQIEAARLCILSFVAEVLNTEASNAWDTSDDFLDILFIMFYEKNLRPFLCAMLIGHLTKPNIQISHYLSPFLLTVICSTFKNISVDARDDLLLLDLVAMITRILDFDPSLGQDFSDIHASLLRCMVKTFKNPKCLPIVIEIIDFFAAYSVYLPVDSRMIDILTSTLEAVGGPNPSFFRSCISLIAGQVIDDPKPDFIAKNNLGFIFLLETYKKQPEFHDIIDFIKKLCDFSSANAFACFKARVDLWILDYIDNTRSEANGLITVSMFVLLTKIANANSSAPVVHKMISLLAPIDGRFIPQTHPLVIASMTDMISMRTKFPSGQLPVGKVPTFVELKGIPFEKLNGGFSICLWINPERGGSGKSQLFSFGDIIIGSYCPGYICVSCGSVVAKISIKDIPDAWSLLGIAIEKKGEKNVMMITLNGILKNEEQVQLPDLFETTFRIGSSELGRVCSVGPFGIFASVLTTNFKLIYEDGPLMVSRIQPIVYATGEISHNALTYTVMGCEEATLKIVGPSVSQQSSFADILTLLCKPQVILPIFAQIDFTMANGEKSPDFFNAAIQLLSAALTFREEPQRSFTNAGGFSAFAFLLESNSPVHLTYSLYMQLINLLDSISYRPLAESLIFNILMNLGLWCRGDHSVTLKITEQWPNLFPRHKEEIISVFSFGSFAEQLSHVSSNECEEKDKEIRDSITTVLKMIASEKFTLTDLNSIISMCTLNRDRYIAHEIIILIRDLALMPNSPFDKIENSIEALLPLHQFLMVAEQRIVFSSISMFAAFHRTSFFTIDPEIHTAVLMDLASPSQLNQQLLQGVCSLATLAAPELLSFCFFASTAAKIDHTDLSSLIQFNILKSSAQWIFWATISAVLEGGDYSKHIFKAIALATGQPWLTKYVWVCNACIAMNDIMYIGLEMFLETTLDLLMSQTTRDINNEMLVQFVACATLFIFFQPVCEVSNSLGRLFCESPFDFKYEEPHPKLRIPMKQDIQINIGARLKQPQGFRFGLRLRNDGTWRDGNLALKMVEFGIKTRSKIQTFGGIACSLAMKDKLTYEKAAKIMSQLTQLYPTVVTASNQSIQQFASEFAQNAEELSNLRYNGLVTAMKFNQDAIALRERILSTCDSQLSPISETENIDRRKSWQRLWQSLTSSLAPWSRATVSQEVHWKRDRTLNSLGFPFRVKQNRKFDDHRLASAIRDAGSAKDGAKLAEKSAEKIPQLESCPNVYQLSQIAVEHNSEDQIESSLLNLECDLVTPSRTTASRLIISSTRVQIVRDDRVFTIHPEDVRFVLQRHFLHRPTGIEFFTINGDSFLVNLKNHNSITVLKKLTKLHTWQSVIVQTVPPRQIISKLGITDQWVNRKLSNFAYLMFLNTLSGRTFNDPEMYPVFPWILAKYDKDIDLNDPSYFRDLSKPMGAIDPDRLENAQDRLNALIETNAPNQHLYDSGYVSSLSVFCWLIRLEPFTTEHIKLQSGKFDHAARLFRSIKDSYRFCTTRDNDYRELIPEFFYLPGFLSNSEHFDLGTVDGKPVDDVELPLWAKGSRLRFVYLNRKAIESDYVSAHIHNWIDLIWGYKQDGPEAAKANNTFHRYMYSTAWNEQSLSDPIKRMEIEAVMRHCGQIPIKMFTAPHPIRNQRQSSVFSSEQKTLQVSAEPITACFFRLQNENIGVRIVTKSGNLISGSVSSRSNAISLEVAGKVETDEDSLMRFAPLHKTGFVYGDSMGGVQVKDGSSTPTSLHMHVGTVNCVACDERHIVSGGSDTATNIWSASAPYALKFSVQSYCDNVACVDVCSDFQSAVCGTDDGHVFVISTTSGDVMQHISVDRRIERILVTIGWGFVVVYETEIRSGETNYIIETYTIDGEKIAECGLPAPIVCWSKFTTRDGFDYVIFVCSGGRIFYFEVFFLKLIEVQYRLVPNIVSVAAFPSISVAVAATSLGDFVLIPLQIAQQTRF